MESRIPVEILGLLRWIARDNDLVISSIAGLVGRGAGCGVVLFLAEDELDLEFLNSGSRHSRGTGEVQRFPKTQQELRQKFSSTAVQVIDSNDKTLPLHLIWIARF